MASSTVVMPSVKTLDMPAAKTAAKSTATNGKVTTYDRFKLGWRMRPRLTEDGHLVHDRIPLTAYDILHPQVGDFQGNGYEHSQFCFYLLNAFQSRLSRDPYAVVLSQVRVAWDIANLEPHGPDIAVIFGVREEKNWETFDVTVEGTRPILIVEITNPQTRCIDLDDKADEYALAGVAYYVIIDTYIGRMQPAYRLLGHQLTPEGYVGMTPNEQGWLWLEPVKLWIGLNQNQLACYDVNNERIPNYVELTQSLQDAK